MQGTHRTPPAADGLIGSGPALLRDAVRTFYEGWREVGDVARFRLRPLPISLYLAADPEDVRRVFQEPNFGKVPVQNEKMKEILGEGLFTSEGDLWKGQRRLMQLVFHRSRHGQLVDATRTATEAMIDRWQAQAAAGRTVDVRADVMRLTLRVLLTLLFSRDRDGEFDALTRALAISDRHLDEVERFSFLAPRWLSYPRWPGVTAARRTIDAIITRRIELRRRDGDADDDLVLAMMHAAHPETGAHMTDRQIRDEIITLLMGDRITSPVLVWAWWLLANHADVERRLRSEVSSVLGSRPVTVADLPRLPYGAQVIAEVLRLYPPAWLAARVAVADDTLGGYHVPAGTRVLVSPYITHRHPRYWADPERFDPERFAPSRQVDRPRFAYFPFGGGARSCIAGSFVGVQTQTILTTVLQRCLLRPVTNLAGRAGATPLLTPVPTLLMRADAVDR